uniref:Ectonucleotide pyrophosphatase/phosphodiesterase family member 5-like n=1 Tax=Phallusia mammillata TaxID=59560 RepID=A0A6F9DC57_9ASCI|nr:ectonucleotide pyrophosphatase/phosphodiesterase family member 5-like [Phallusia mammillata]
MIGQCDNITGYLIRQLELSGIFDDVNIIITSDHGMATLNQTRTAAIKPHLNMTEIDQYINYGTGAAIWPKAGYIDSTYQSLLGIGSHVSVWKKDNIPLEFHYRSNVRIPPILLMPQDKWFLVNNSKDPINLRGSHGYNNSLMDMHPFFIARGPAFRSGFVSEPFRSVDIYGLICEIMGLDPAPNNGSLSEVQQLLAPSDYFLATVIGVIVGSVLASFVLVSILIYFNKGIIRKRPKTDSFSSGSRPLLESNIS